MTATREAPAEIENITGEFKGSVSKRGISKPNSWNIQPMTNGLA